MGTITNAIKVKDVVEKFKIGNFVETGTGAGDTLNNVLNFFPAGTNFYTIELVDQLYANALERFKHIKNLNVLQGYSHEQIKTVISQLDSEPTLFWHDAHFPGADFGIASYDGEPDPIKRIPLEQELVNVVQSGRDITRDVFVLDDLRVYKDGPFQYGNWDIRAVVGGDSIDFVYRLFDATHVIFERFWDQGYVVMFPKNLSSAEYNKLMV